MAYEPLLSSPCWLDELALDDALAASVEKSRAEVRAVLDGADGGYSQWSAGITKGIVMSNLVEHGSGRCTAPIDVFSPVVP
jgi:hypothetical protein